MRNIDIKKIIIAKAIGIGEGKTERPATLRGAAGTVRMEQGKVGWAACVQAPVVENSDLNKLTVV